MARNHKQLDIYNQAYDFALEIYKATASFLYGFDTPQLAVVAHLTSTCHLTNTRAAFKYVN